MRDILVLKTGESFSSITEHRGDFEEWIRAGIEIEPVRMHVVRPYRGEPLPDPHDYSGIIITGSSAIHSLSRRMPVFIFTVFSLVWPFCV